MRVPPFNIMMLLFGICLSVFLIGALIGGVSGASDLPILLSLFLSAFIPFLLAGYIRAALGAVFSGIKNAREVQPVAFPLYVRIVLGAVLSAGFSILFSRVELAQITPMVGGLIAVMTTGALSILFLFVVMFRD